MISTTKVSRAKVRVTFELPDDGPSVGVAGDFNDWDASTTPLRRRSGTRRASVVLEAGRRYGFRYRNSDGEWFNDTAAHDYEPTELGVENGIIDLA